MKLTKAQKEQRALIASCKAKMLATEEVYEEAKKNHKCIAMKGSCDSAICAICGDELGWWCPKSRDHVCVYRGGFEACAHCGNPDERK